MTTIKHFIASLLLSLFLFQLAQADHQLINTSGADRKSLQIMECGSACTARCQLSSRPHLCKRACGTCCARCNCVPPGTSGNQEVCPCYYTMTTHGGKRKCP